MYNETLKTQYEIMTEENIQDGEYVPNLEALIQEAPNVEMRKAWEQVQELMEKTKDSDWAFGGFAFRIVYTHQKKDGSYTIYQHGVPEEWTIEKCEKELFRWIREVEKPF